MGVVNLLATRFNLYWSLEGFDKFAHFVAGVSIGYLFFWFYFWLYPTRWRSKINLFLLAIAFILIVGVAWEVFEVYIGERGFHGKDYWRDTILDLICDTLGTLTAFATVSSKINQLIESK